MKRAAKRTPPEELAARRLGERLPYMAVLSNWPKGKVGAIRGMRIDPIELKNLKSQHLQNRMPK